MSHMDVYREDLWEVVLDWTHNAALPKASLAAKTP